jgi:hypothetical protein
MPFLMYIVKPSSYVCTVDSFGFAKESKDFFKAVGLLTAQRLDDGLSVATPISAPSRPRYDPGKVGAEHPTMRMPGNESVKKSGGQAARA